MAGWKKSIDTLKQMFAMEGYWRYLVPFAVYLFAGSIVSLFLPGLEEYHLYISYTLRTVVVGLLLWKVRHRFTELADKKLLIDPTALVLGTTIFLVWIGLEGRYPLFTSSDVHFNPTDFEGTLTLLLILMRFIGSVLVAPVIEELVMRSFFIRYIISPKWEDVPIGTYTFESFAIITLVFGFSHYRWLAGIITAVILNLLLYRKKSIVPCIVAHAVANLLLLVYVVATNSWFFY
ncbi:MAG: CAAX prenyl protease-related protein [Candidatus Hydrothermarchaeales archaeon]